jgi:hypothetical protein
MKYWIIPLIFFLLETFTYQRMIVCGIYAVLVYCGFIMDELIKVKKELKKDRCK